MTQAEFKQLFDNYFDEIRNYIYFRCGDTDLATDLAQDTFLKVWEKQFKVEPKKIRALLYKISGDLFVNNYRKQKTALNFQLSIKSTTEQQTPEDQIQFEELSQQYDKALKQLPENQRVVFMMSRIDQLKYQEIASSLGLSVKAVEKRMTLALASIKKVLIS